MTQTRRAIRTAWSISSRPQDCTTRVIAIGIEIADMLVQEISSQNLRDRRAVARYGSLTGSPNESGKKR